MSKMTEFDIGDTVTLRVSFAVGSVATDPTTITLTITDPAGAATPYTFDLGQVTRDDTGDYSKSVSASAAGEWTATWTGTGACAASVTKRFAVRRDGA